MNDERMDMPVAQGRGLGDHTETREINDATTIIDQTTGTLITIAENLEQLYARLKGNNAPSGADNAKSASGETTTDPADAVLPALTRVTARNQVLTLRVNALVGDLLEIL